MNWIAYNFAHDVTLPGSTRGIRCASSCIRKARPPTDASTRSMRTTSSTRLRRGKSSPHVMAKRGFELRWLEPERAGPALVGNPPAPIDEIEAIGFQ